MPPDTELFTTTTIQEGADVPLDDAVRGGDPPGTAEGKDPRVSSLEKVSERQPDEPLDEGSRTDDRHVPADTRYAPTRPESGSDRDVEIARMEARTAAIIETLDGQNPYTHTPMKDAADVDVYLRQKAIEKRGGDPIGGYAEAMAEETRARDALRKSREEADRWYAADAAAFAEAHPDVNMVTLLADPDFHAFADGKLGKVPLATIYEGYTGMVDRHRREAREEAEREAAFQLARAEASVGSLKGRGMPPAVTREQFRKMSYREREKLYKTNPELYKMVSG